MKQAFSLKIASPVKEQQVSVNISEGIYTWRLFLGILLSLHKDSETFLPLSSCTNTLKPLKTAGMLY